MLEQDAARSTRRALMPKRLLLTMSVAIGLVGAMALNKNSEAQHVATVIKQRDAVG